MVSIGLRLLSQFWGKNDANGEAAMLRKLSAGLASNLQVQELKLPNRMLWRKAEDASLLWDVFHAVARENEPRSRGTLADIRTLPNR